MAEAVPLETADVLSLHIPDQQVHAVITFK